MPTPNQSIIQTPAITVDAPRPSRIQLACPEETAAIHPSTAGWQSLVVLRQDATTAAVAAAAAATPTTTGTSPCPPEQQVLEQPTSPASSSADDEKAPSAATTTNTNTTTTTTTTTPTTTTTTTAAAATATMTAATDDQRNTTEKDAQSVASPTTVAAAQKIFTRQLLAEVDGESSGGSSTLDCPFVPSPDHDFSTKRVLPSYSCSFLRPGSKFVGKQTSDRSTYEVHVELKHVNMAESFLCGYLRIKGLTEDHPTLTTYFEGEMIGDKYSFKTRRPEWGSNEKNDIQHWSRFPAFRPLVSKAKRSEFNYTNFAQKENIFMRWKEYFLVPDHRVRQITGASFEGFYYICFNQVSGTVDGIYFHAKSEKFQKLQLKHVPERTFACVEFR